MSMTRNKGMEVVFANHNFVYRKFQERLKNLCKKISTNDQSSFATLNNNNLAITEPLIFEHLNNIDSLMMKVRVKTLLKTLRTKINKDTEYFKLCGIKNKTSKEMISYNQKYYLYLIELFEIIGIFGDMLSQTFMPRKGDRQKLLRFVNDLAFFENFSEYKAKASDKISEFSIYNFKESFGFFLGFYYAYYLFIDDRSRLLCENVLTNILNIVLNKKVLSLAIENFELLSTKNQMFIRETNNQLRLALNGVFYRCNCSYSDFGILPKKYEKVLIDRTSI